MPDFNRVVAQLSAAYPDFNERLHSLLREYADPSEPAPAPHPFTIDVNQQSPFCKVCDGGTRHAIHDQTIYPAGGTISLEIFNPVPEEHEQ